MRRIKGMFLWILKLLGVFFLYSLGGFICVRPRAKEEEFCLLYVAAVYNLTRCFATIWVTAMAS